MDVFNFCKPSHIKLITWKAKMSRLGILTLGIALVSWVHGNAGQSGPDYAYKRTKRIVSVVEESAWRWYESPEYSAIKHYREEASEGWGAIVPGYVTKED
jgi:hypothetical protein